MVNVGQTLHHRGEDDALIQYKEFMRITLPLLGYKHRDVAFMLKCIGRESHHQRGETELALTVYKQALVACKRALGIMPKWHQCSTNWQVYTMTKETLILR